MLDKVLYSRAPLLPVNLWGRDLCTVVNCAQCVAQLYLVALSYQHFTIFSSICAESVSSDAPETLAFAYFSPISLWRFSYIVQ